MDKGGGGDCIGEGTGGFRKCVPVLTHTYAASASREMQFKQEAYVAHLQQRDEAIALCEQLTSENPQ